MTAASSVFAALYAFNTNKGKRDEYKNVLKAILTAMGIFLAAGLLCAIYIYLLD